jgi:rod shape-determining protein MreB
MGLLGLRGVRENVALDLGTTSTRIWIVGRGLVLDEPSKLIVRRGQLRDEILAIGAAAHEIQGRTSGPVDVVHPLQDGVVTDFSMLECLVRYFLERTVGGFRGWFGPNVLTCIPDGLGEVEQRAVQDAIRKGGARSVRLVHRAVAAAIGADLPVLTPKGHFICDLGGGTTEVAVVSLGGTVAARSVPCGGAQMDHAIVEAVLTRHGVHISLDTAREVKQSIGAASRLSPPIAMRVTGRDTQNGIPRTVNVSSDDIAPAIAHTLERVLDAIARTLQETPAELCGDLLDSGIVLTGGGAKLRGLADLLTQRTGLPTTATTGSEHAVARGAGAVLANESLRERVAH